VNVFCVNVFFCVNAFFLLRNATDCTVQVREHDNEELVDELRKMKISVLRDRAEKSGIKDVEIDAALDMGHADGHDALIDLILIAEEQVGLDRCERRVSGELETT